MFSAVYCDWNSTSLRVILLGVVLLLTGPVLSGGSARAALQIPDDQRTLQEAVQGQLAGTLLRSRAEEDALLSLRKTGVSDSSFDVLQQIFSRQADAFLWDPERQDWRSLRAFAMDLLKRAPDDIQRAWDRTITVSTEGRLRTALATGDFEELEAIAEACPLSEAGLRSEGMLLAALWLKGEATEADLQWNCLQADYADSVLEGSFRQQLLTLRNAVQKRLTAEIGNNHNANPVAGTSRDNRVLTTVSPPWPEISWTWQETVWVPGAEARLNASSLLMNYGPEFSGILRDFQNWPLVHWGPWLICRTPFRIVALEKSTGRECWSLVTDSLGAGSGTDSMGLGGINFPPGGPGMDELRPDALPQWGLLSRDAEYLWLIDCFDVLGREMNADRRPWMRGRRPGIFSGNAATQADFIPSGRLLALKRSAENALPEIAWIAGDTSPAGYQIVEQLKDQSRTEPDLIPEGQAENLSSDEFYPAPGLFPASTDQPDSGANTETDFRRSPTVTGHRFQCPPVIRGERLYLLSKTADFLLVNCLHRTTGRVIWQQPVSWADQGGNGPDMSVVSNQWQSCLICGDNLICSLASGDLVAVSTATGQLKWALSQQNETAEKRLEEAFANEFLISPDATTPALFLPLTEQGVVVCSAPNSGAVMCVNGLSGRILWKVPNRAVVPGEPGGSRDLYPAAIVNGRLILIGQRHCRCLDLQDGSQLWVTEIDETGGMAVCGTDRCVIPQIGAQPVCISLRDGTRLQEATRFQPHRARLPFGAFTSDTHSIYASNPGVVVAFPRADVVASTANATPAEDDPQSVLQAARAMMIDGRRQDAKSLLQTQLQSANLAADETAGRTLVSTLAELLLGEWLESWLKASGLPSDESRAATVKQLADLQLTPDQTVRAATLALLTGLHEEALPQSWRAQWQSPNRKTLLTLSSDWSVRPDLLLEQPPIRITTASDQGKPATGGELTLIAEDAILHPQSLTTETDTVQLARQLIDNGQATAAELLLASWWQSLSENRGDERNRVEKLLDQVRNGASLNTEVLTDFNGRTPDFAGPSGDLPDTDAETLTLAPEFHLALPVPEFALNENQMQISAGPWWLKHDLVVSNSREEPQTHRLEVVARDGAGVLSRLPKVGGMAELTTDFQQSNRTCSAPGLIPLIERTRLMMTAVNNSGQTRILWDRELNPRQDLVSGKVILGSLGPDYFVWHFAGTLYCTHPLTGTDLWTRRVGEVSNTVPRLQSAPAVFGDERVTAVYSVEQGLLQTFSTRTGKPVQRKSVMPGLGTECGAVGRFLIYTDLNYQLHLLDTEQGEDILADEEPIRMGQMHLGRLYSVLPGNQLVTVTHDSQIVVISLNTGNVSRRIAPRVPGQFAATFAVKAFERAGRVFIAVEENLPGAGAALLQVRGEDTLESLSDGTLSCLSPDRDRIEWTLRLENCVFPQITGDATDVLIACTTSFGRDRMADGGLTELLDVKVIPYASGELALEEKGMPLSSPQWIRHDAAKRQIQIQCDDGRILLRRKPR